ncbi:AAA domain-containing protein [Halocatena salina]|uniref:AAA domain-containing protein n=1 Tax=Halocatena salina TaxID=2934340 RepID=A0A8U0A120_9EURY|nr:AAA domain-containing protein [Halocatena salina]UPM42830.1 AAA domain-containing protein [Halocatena salina]
MSLVFESAIDAFSIETATLVCPAASAVTPADRGDEAIPVAGVIEHARRHPSLVHPDDEDDVCVPLHEPTSATLSDEYVIYTDHPIHGEIFVYEEDGERAFVQTEAFGATPLARRLRFWHSDYVPETEPAYYSSPLSDTEPPRNPVGDPDEFFDQLLGFVDREREARRTEHRTRLDARSPTEIYEDGGAAIPSLDNPGNGRGQRFTFRLSDAAVASALSTEHASDDADGNGRADRTELPHRFVQQEFGIHEGNEALLSPPNREHSPSAFPLAVTVDTIRNRNVVLTVDWETIDAVNEVDSFLRQQRRGFGLALLLNGVPYDRQADSIRELNEDRTFRGLMTGQVPVTFSDTGAIESTQHDDDLNQEQQLAVEHALLADPLFCIHGPPGTGKTRTLVEIVRRAATAGQRVLVCADSNQAIDNILVGDSTSTDVDDGSLHAHAQHGTEEFTVKRNNARRSTHPAISDWYSSVSGIPDVVVTTASSAARLDGRFDLAVIDEATQATCTTTCIPMVAAEKVVLAGDHKQLPPFSASDSPPDSAFGMSLFEHLYADGGVYEGVGIQLRTQYRMHRDIARFPNRRFYDRSLRQGHAIEPLVTESNGVLGNGASLMGYDIGGSESLRENSLYNEPEAELVTYLVGQLRSLPAVGYDDIGVIAPYTAQVATINSLLATHLPRGTDVTVDTIDSFQGGERDAIVISLVRSNPTGELGFLDRRPDGPRRLNVALTRARRFCGIIGDWSTLTAATDCTDLYRSLHAELADTNRLKSVDPTLLDLSALHHD